MILAGLTFGGIEWFWTAIALIAAAGLLLWYGAAAYRHSSPTGYLPIACKLLAMLLLAACLTEPLWSSVRTRPGANLFLILADNSASLTIRDAEASTSRGDQLKSMLTDRQRSWLTHLEQEFDVRRFEVSQRLETIDDYGRLDFREPHSAWHLALKQLGQRFTDRPVAGVLLLTDGIATDDRPPGWSADNLPPIYPILFGKSDGLKDISLDHVGVSLTAFEDAPVTIVSEIRQQGFDGQVVSARVLDQQQAVVKEETLTLPENGRGTSVRFQIRPATTGLNFYTLAVEPVAKDKVLPSEATQENNRRRIVVERGSGPYRVLYVSGRPNWEFKFLNRAIEDDEQVELTSLIRIAKREPKFDWRGRAGESSNPLYRGFDGVDAETERFDQPVIVRLNTEDSQELRDGFPKTAEELFPFHAVVIDDLEAEFFTTGQMELLERFVSERGGSLLMLGGQESFAAGGYRRTPLARVLPVSMDENSLLLPPSAQWKLSLTRDGWLQPWARLRSTEDEETARLKSWPRFQTLNPAGREKPGAMVIAEVEDRSGTKQPALAAHRFGEGRSAAVLIGDLWRAQLQQTDDQRQKNDLAKSWRQLVRWLIADVPERIEIRSQPVEDDPAVRRLEMKIRAADFQPQDNCHVVVTATLPDGSKLKLPAEPSLAEAGLYEVLVTSAQPGNYQAEVTATGDDSQVIGTNATGWVNDPAAQEFRSVIPDRAWVEELAKATGGEVVSADQLEQFVQSLVRKPAPITEAVTSPLWQHPLVLALILVGLCGEWGLRRWRGLP